MVAPRNFYNLWQKHEWETFRDCFQRLKGIPTVSQMSNKLVMSFLFQQFIVSDHSFIYSILTHSCSPASYASFGLLWLLMVWTGHNPFLRPRVADQLSKSICFWSVSSIRVHNFQFWFAIICNFSVPMLLPIILATGAWQNPEFWPQTRRFWPIA